MDSPPPAVTKAAHGVLSSGELALPLTSCSTWENGSCTSLDNTTELILMVGGSGQPVPREAESMGELVWVQALCLLSPVAVGRTGSGVMRAGEIALHPHCLPHLGEWALRFSWTTRWS